ncbi:MAG: hypothetical protein MUE44_19350 [Oscillatoriaceae cyanobacterium Prado104]|jgi:hypothetical protein|nr:hypothetical protein [Oscillatoriaceae cyanobacterium Prado104]
MKKVTKIQPKQNLSESRVKDNLESIALIRSDSINDLENLTTDFKHMSLVVESVRRNYQALLAQNQLLKDTLLSVVENCECWQGNRCDRCLQILNILGGKNLELKPDAAKKYKTLLTQLRKLG